jgi:hypothetical protein
VADRGTPSWPKITIRLYDAHNGEVKIAGRSHPLVAADPREAAIAVIAERAGQLGRPVKATAVEADGTSWPLIIHPDGQVDALDANAPERKPIWPILVAAGIAVVLVTATVLYLAVLRDKPVAQPTGSPTLPALPSPNIKPDVFDARPFPPGFSTTATWSVDLAESTNPAVSADETKVAIITTDQKIAMLNGAGQVLWQDMVPEGTKTPVFTTVDDKPVVAAQTEGQLYYWPVDGGFPSKAKLASGTEVQFFGRSPMLTDQNGTAYVLTGGKWVAISGKPRRATILYADGKRVLMAGYYGPLFWGEPEKDPNQVDLRKPAGATGIDHVVVASPGKVIAMWRTKNPEERIPAVHNAENGALLATCKPTLSSSPGDWVPDPAGKVAALGPCLIDFAKQKTYQLTGFQPVSTQRTAIYGNGGTGLTLITPGGKPKVLPAETARPWGIVAGHAIVVHEQVLYALAQPKGSR